MTIYDALKQDALFSDSEKEIAAYIIAQKEEILKKSVHDIADATFTSTSSIVRLCKKIGFDGFKDFKIRLAAELEHRVDQRDDTDPDFPFVKNDTALDIAQKMDVLMINSIEASYGMITKQAKQLQKAAKLIADARVIYLTGTGDSYLKGKVFQSNMTKIHKMVLMQNVPGEDTSMIDTLTTKDCAIVISYSGKTRSVFELVRVLKRKAIPIVAITANPDSNIGKAADILLQMPEKEEKWVKQATFTSQAATEYYLNVLYSYIYVMDYELNNEYRNRNISEFSDVRY